MSQRSDHHPETRGKGQEGSARLAPQELKSCRYHLCIGDLLAFVGLLHIGHQPLEKRMAKYRSDLVSCLPQAKLSTRENWFSFSRRVTGTTQPSSVEHGFNLSSPFCGGVSTRIRRRCGYFPITHPRRGLVVFLPPLMPLPNSVVLRVVLAMTVGLFQCHARSDAMCRL